MELILRAHANDGRQSDLVVDVDATHSVAELAGAMAQQLGLRDRSPLLTLLRTGSGLDPRSSIGDSGIVSGDDVMVGFAGGVERVPPLPTEAISLDVLAGPDAGVSITLLPGSLSVGRDPSADVALSDPTVSRRHAEIEIDHEWMVTVVPSSDVSNPVMVNDIEIEQPTLVSATDVVGLGGTRVALRRFVRAEGERVDQLGQIEFQRTPYRPPMVSEREAPELGKIPERGEPQRFKALAALAPLAAGLTMFAFTRQPQFLILTMMSPLVVIATRIDDKKSGRRKFADDLVKFENRLVAWRGEIDALNEAERVERLRSAPDLADLARRAELRTVDLWARGREAPDFLHLRVGLGDMPSHVEVDIGRTGDDDLREQALEAIEGVEVIPGVPVIADLKNVGAFGLHGPAELVDGVASSMVVQAATLHSPEDVTIAAALSGDRPLVGWLKWLPHLRSITSPLGGKHVITDVAEVDTFIGRLLEVAEFRLSGGDREVEGRRWPWIVALIDARLSPDPAAVARLLDTCPTAGISVIWLAATAAEIPRQAAEVLVTRHAPGAALVGTVWSTDPEIADREIEVEQLRPAIADRVARALAPVRDASTASLANSIPRVAPLLDVLGVGMPTPDWVKANWAAKVGYGLEFAIGIGADGPLMLDLVEDGPHTLIGGTSGAGKSELMQSIVASLAVKHPPTALNFLFVDYKGGASSNVFGVLPHTVGYVTNLSAELSLRALTSLRAELNRRMMVMEGKAKDLAEMIELYPDEAPASLVIIVDEFATLVKEVPEFVAGVVDIAQRGRSLGIHLILATQRPSGSVNENILANTNLRMSLRMLDRTESTSVIDSPEAADIPVPLKGRAYARLGPRTLAAFQSAFCGAPLTTEETQTPVLASGFIETNDSPKAMPGSGGGGGNAPSNGTHLDAVLRAIIGASAELDMPEPLKPWRDVLPDQVTIGEVLADPRSAPAHAEPGKVIAVGMIDAPERQDQFPALVDLEEGGGWSIFGSGGAGKTTVLRTVAVSVAACAGPDRVEVLGLDFASRGLASILPLPNVVDVASGDDLEAITRHIAGLDAELGRRRELLAASHAEHLTAYNERNDPLPRILVLIDGFGGFMSLFTGASGMGSAMASAIPMESWVELMNTVIVEGRQVGMHVVVTVDRRNALPTRLHSAIGNRLILRHADETSYTEHGIPMSRAKGMVLAPGRGLWQADATVQIATASVDPVGGEQGKTIAAFAEQLTPAGHLTLESAPLPEILRLDELRALVPTTLPPLHFPLGLRDLSNEPVVIDMTWSNVVVAGAGRSGRSSTLVAAALGLRDEHRVWAIGPSSTLLTADHAAEFEKGRPEVVMPLLERLAGELDALSPGERADQPHVLIVDDIDTFEDMAMTQIWDRLSKFDDLRIIASMETRALTGYTANPVMNVLRRSRRMLLLQPDDATEVLQAVGVKAPMRPGQRMMAGRGVLVADRLPSVVHVALPA